MKCYDYSEFVRCGFRNMVLVCVEQRLAQGQLHCVSEK